MTADREPSTEAGRLPREAEVDALIVAVHSDNPATILDAIAAYAKSVRAEVRSDLARQVAAWVGKRLTDARVDELMRQEAIPLHGRPVDLQARYVAARIRGEIVAILDGLAGTDATPTVWSAGTACGGCIGLHPVHNQRECVRCDCDWQRGIDNKPSGTDATPEHDATGDDFFGEKWPAVSAGTDATPEPEHEHTVACNHGWCEIDDGGLR